MVETDGVDPEIDELHCRAVEEDLDSYVDPATGCAVFTAAYLVARGTCCGSGCRHCPYGDGGRPAPGRGDSGP